MYSDSYLKEYAKKNIDGLRKFRLVGDSLVLYLVLLDEKNCVLYCKEKDCLIRALPCDLVCA